MMTDNKTWEEFCELYFDEAKRYADIHLAKHIEKNGAPNRRVDLSYVKDAAVLAVAAGSLLAFRAPPWVVTLFCAAAGAVTAG